MLQFRTICEENVADCKALLQPDKTTQDGSCDRDYHYKVSDKNLTGPHAGTCSQYERWDATRRSPAIGST